MNRIKPRKRKYKIGSSISADAQNEIQKIMNGLRAASLQPNRHKEIEIIRTVCKSGETQAIKPTIVDLYLERKNGKIYLIDIKTAKPNK